MENEYNQTEYIHRIAESIEVKVSPRIESILMPRKKSEGNWRFGKDLLIVIAFTPYPFKIAIVY